MKLLIVTSLKEYQKDVASIFRHAAIEVFSVSETKGFREGDSGNLLDNWFSSGSEHFDSIFFFSFTEGSKAEQALELVQKYNDAANTKFPVRVFIVPVEKANY